VSVIPPPKAARLDPDSETCDGFNGQPPGCAPIVGQTATI
jgi:hypothetical protein